jgi:hypothetical protein
MKYVSILFAGAAFALAATSSLAQDQQAGAGSMQGMQHGGMMGMNNMMGMHMMTVTVTAIDSKTGLVDATAGSMALKLHFPPASLAGVKAGDKLSVHLGFNKL